MTKRFPRKGKGRQVVQGKGDVGADSGGKSTCFQERWLWVGGWLGAGNGSGQGNYYG